MQSSVNLSLLFRPFSGLVLSTETNKKGKHFQIHVKEIHINTDFVIF